MHEAAPTPYQRAIRRLPINSYSMMKHLRESSPIVKLFRLLGGAGLYAGSEFWWVFSQDCSRGNCPLNEFIHSFSLNSTAVCQVLFWVLKCRGGLGKYHLLSLEDLIIVGGWEWIGESKYTNSWDSFDHEGHAECQVWQIIVQTCAFILKGQGQGEG